MTTLDRRARTARTLSLVGAALTTLVAVRTVDAHDLGGLLDGAGIRPGTTNALTAFALAAAAAAAGAGARRAPGWATFVLGAATAAGAFAVGGLWLLPAPVLLAAALWALMAVPDPFARDAAHSSAADAPDAPGGDVGSVQAPRTLDRGQDRR